MELEPNPIAPLQDDMDGSTSGSSNNLSMQHNLAPALYSANNASQTEIKVENLVHNWTVKNFSHCYQEYLENFVHLHKEETLTWSVKIYPKGNGDNNKDFVFLCLNRVANSQPSSSQPVGPTLPPHQMPMSGPNQPTGAVPGPAAVGTNCTNTGKLFSAGKIGFRSRFTLRNGENKEIEMRVHPNPSHSDYVSYIKRDVLFPQILPEDTIIVTVEIDVAVETITVTNQDQIQTPNTSIQLVRDYNSLLERDELRALSDFRVHAGDKIYSVHRAILACRSEVFMAMLSHVNTDESMKGQITIPDVDAEVVGEMLKFIYTGRCERGLKEFAADLLVAADKYALHDLKTCCEKELINALATENCCQLFVMADCHRAMTLRRCAIDFILANTQEVVSTQGWKQMLQAHPCLVTEIVQNFNPHQTKPDFGTDRMQNFIPPAPSRRSESIDWRRLNP